MITKTISETLPVPLATVKANLGIEHSLDDDRITRLIWAAVGQIEAETGKAFAANEYDWTLPKFEKVLYFPRFPVSSVTVEYYDEDNANQTLASNQYYFIAGDYGAYLTPVVNFPATYVRPDAVRINFVTGVTTVPPEFTELVCLIVSWYNENREGSIRSARDWSFAGIERLTDLLREGAYH